MEKCERRRRVKEDGFGVFGGDILLKKRASASAHCSPIRFCGMVIYLVDLTSDWTPFEIRWMMGVVRT